MFERAPQRAEVGTAWPHRNQDDVGDLHRLAGLGLLPRRRVANHEVNVGAGGLPLQERAEAGRLLSAGGGREP